MQPKGVNPLRIRVMLETAEEQMRTDNDEATVYLAATEGIAPQRVTFIYADGKKVQKYVKSGSCVTFPEDPAKEGYTFLGWYQGDVEFTKDTAVTQNVTSIGSKAFSGCKNLKTIQIDSKVLKTVGRNAFYKIHKDAKIKVPGTKLKKYLKLLRKKGQKSTVEIKKK